MNTQIEDIRLQLNAGLKNLAYKNGIEGAIRSLNLVKDSIAVLTEYLSATPFEDLGSEIYYFRVQAPFFYSRLFLYIKVINLEIKRRTLSEERLERYIRSELREREIFFQKNAEIVDYLLTGSTHRDSELFTRGGNDITLDDIAVVLSKDLCPASYRAAWMLAYQDYPNIVKQDAETAQGFAVPKRKYEWAASVADAAEVITGFNAKRAIKIDGQDAGLKEIAEMWEDFFHFAIPNIYDTKRYNRRRKKENAPFLMSMIEAIKGPSTKPGK